MTEPYQYPLNELYFSYQGEGQQIGRPVIFVRLSHCNLSCAFCDTNYEPEIGRFSAVEIVNKINKIYDTEYPKGFNEPSVLITGGEPSVHKLSDLLIELKENRYWVGIESNGTNDLTQYSHLLDHITVSPKAPKGLNQRFADELRLVAQTWVNINEMKRLEKEVRARNYFISPLEQSLDPVNFTDGPDFNLLRCYDLLRMTRLECKYEWRLSLQTHKLIRLK